MDKEEKYQRILKILRNSQPTLDDRQEITDEVMRQIHRSTKQSEQRNLTDYLFGWWDHYWMRRAMAACALVLLGIFVAQQITISDRIRSLEKQLVRTASTMNGHQPEPGINQQLLMNIFINDQQDMDSITVSRSDLEDLLQDYLELQENYENVIQDYGLDPFLERRIRPGPGRSVD